MDHLISCGAAASFCSFVEVFRDFLTIGAPPFSNLVYFFLDARIGGHDVHQKYGRLIPQSSSHI